MARNSREEMRSAGFTWTMMAAKSPLGAVLSRAEHDPEGLTAEWITEMVSEAMAALVVAEELVRDANSLTR